MTITMDTLPAGTYVGRAAGNVFRRHFRFGRTEGGQRAEQIAVLIQLTSEGWRDVHITWYGSFIPGIPTEHTLENLRHLGWHGDDFVRMPGLGAQAVSVIVKWEDWRGSPKVRVSIAPICVAVRNELSDAETQALVARLQEYAPRG